MKHSPFAANEHYVIYESQLRQLHALIAEGDGDGEAADRLRAAMEDPERHLTDAELARLNGLAADLYMLEGDELYAPSRHGVLEPGDLHQQLLLAAEQGSWEEVLNLLRLGPLELPAARIAALRAAAYSALGHEDTALLFARFARERELSARDDAASGRDRTGRGGQPLAA